MRTSLPFPIVSVLVLACSSNNGSSGAGGHAASSTSASSSSNVSSSVSTVSSGTGGTGGGTSSQIQTIFYVMMENHGTAEIFGNTADAPYVNQLVAQYGSATNYFGVTHPSLPNYLAAISGDFQGIWDDCQAGQAVTCAPEEFIAGTETPAQLLTDGQKTSATAKAHWFDGPNLVDQLETKHLTWKAYMQGIPAVGDISEYAPVDMVDGGSVPRKLYAQKHNPFMYFSDIRSSPDRMKLIVPFTQFAADVASTSVPNFVWISPDQCHDMHGLSPVNAAAVGLPGCAGKSPMDHSVITLGDDFLKDTVQKIMASPAWKGNAAIVIAWDEDDYSGYAGCCGSPLGVGGAVLGGAGAPALVITSKNPKHQSLATAFNHYSLLGTIQQLWGLPCLANTCGLAGDNLMTKLFTP